MASLNKVLLLGNLTREPELRYTPGGSAVCEFGIATNRKYTANNQEKEEVCFVDIVVWGKQAESVNRFLSKGSPALIEGRLQFDQWDDKESGKKRSKLRVTAERVQFIGGKGGNDSVNEGQGSYAAPQPKSNYPQQPSQAPQQQQPAAAPQPQAAPAPQQQAAVGYQQPVAPPQQAQVPPQQPYNQAPPAMPNAPFNVGQMDDDIPF
jgi:single-strand DNA-binding protein